MYDPEKKQSRPVRKYLGKVDPETGEIISTKGKRGRPPKKQGSESGNGTTNDYKALYQEQCRLLEETRKELSFAISKQESLTHQNAELMRVLDSIRTQLDSLNTDH